MSAVYGARVDCIVVGDFTSGFAPFGGKHVERDSVEIASKTRACFVARRVSEECQKTLLREFFSASRVLQSAPEKCVHRLAVAFEQLGECFARTLLKLNDELFVGVHRSLDGGGADFFNAPWYRFETGRTDRFLIIVMSRGSE